MKCAYDTTDSVVKLVQLLLRLGLLRLELHGGAVDEVKVFLQHLHLAAADPDVGRLLRLLLFQLQLLPAATSSALLM